MHIQPLFRLPLTQVWTVPEIYTGIRGCLGPGLTGRLAYTVDSLAEGDEHLHRITIPGIADIFVQQCDDGNAMKISTRDATGETRIVKVTGNTENLMRTITGTIVGIYRREIQNRRRSQAIASPQHNE